MPTQPANNIEVQDEAVSQGFIRQLNFTGAGVTAIVAGSLATITIPGGGAGSVDIVAATINAPYESYDYSEVIIDATVTPASLILLGWGATSDDDENGPDMDDLTFKAVAGAGQFTAFIAAPENQPFGGPIKLNYLVG
jgi:hypothetical protein